MRTISSPFMIKIMNNQWHMISKEILHLDYATWSDRIDT